MLHVPPDPAAPAAPRHRRHGRPRRDEAPASLCKTGQQPESPNRWHLIHLRFGCQRRREAGELTEPELRAVRFTLDRRTAAARHYAAGRAGREARPQRAVVSAAMPAAVGPASRAGRRRRSGSGAADQVAFFTPLGRRVFQTADPMSALVPTVGAMSEPLSRTRPPTRRPGVSRPTSRGY